MTVAYRAARVIDGVSEHPAEDVAVIVEGGRIARVGPTRDLPSGTEVVDLGDATLLPGLIDTHVHLVWNASAEPHGLVARESRALTVLRCARNAALHLEAGVTTVRDVGATDGLSIDVARAVELGVLPGPRVVAAGRAIAMTGGHGWFLGREADGPDAVRHAFRKELKNGANCIKLMASGGVYGHAEEPGSPQLTVEEMRAGVDEAHKASRKVAAHAYSVEAIQNALDAGVDSIEHGSFVDEETAGRMRERGVYLVPTMSVYAAMSARGPELGAADYIQRKTAQVLEASREPFAWRSRPISPLQPAPTAAPPATRMAPCPRSYASWWRRESIPCRPSASLRRPPPSCWESATRRVRWNPGEAQTSWRWPAIRRRTSRR
jgi:imidazolonepropionase-like amidohydrolase